MSTFAPFDQPTRQLSGEPVIPFPTESLRSLIARSCFANWLPHSFGLLGPLGLRHRNRVTIAEGDEIRADELAFAIKLPEREIISRRYASLEMGYIEFFGVQVHKSRIDNKTRRFSPAALLEADFHRAFWELRDLPFCLESWDMLRDSCPCPMEPTATKQKWTRTQSRVSECDHCGESLVNLPRQIVPSEYQTDLRLLDELLSPKANSERNLNQFLPNAIAKTDRGRIYNCLRLMCDIAIGGDIEGLNDEYADAILRWHAACQAMRAWPNAFPGQWIKDDVSDSIYAYRRDLYFGLGAEPTSTLVEVNRLARALVSSSASAAISESNEGDICQNTMKTADDSERIAAPRTMQAFNESGIHLIGIRPASEAAKLDPDTLLRARAETKLSKYERRHGQKTVPAFERMEVTKFGLAWNARIPIAKLGFDFNVSHHGIEQLVATGAMEATGLRFDDDPVYFTEDDIATFEKRLKDGATSTGEHWVPLHSAMKEIDDRPKPWGLQSQQCSVAKLPIVYPINTSAICRRSKS